MGEREGGRMDGGWAEPAPAAWLLPLRKRKAGKGGGEGEKEKGGNNK